MRSVGGLHPAFPICLLAFVGSLALASSALADSGEDEVILGPKTEMLGTQTVEDVHGVPAETVIELAADAVPPAQGGSVVMPPSEEAPEGIFGKVTSVSPLPGGRTLVRASPEPLSRAYTEFELDLEGQTLDELQESDATSSSILDELTDVLACEEGSGEASARTTAKLGKLIPRIEISLRKKEFRLELHGRPELGAEINAHGEKTCELKHLAPISIPLPAHGLPLFLTIAPAAKAEVDGDFESSLSWRPEFVVGAERTGEHEVQAIHSLVDQPLEPAVEGAGHLGVDFGIQVGLSLAGRLGIRGTVGPRIDADFNVTPTSSCHSATRSGFVELSGKANFFVRGWKFQLHRRTFGAKPFWQKGNCEAAD